MSYQENFGAAFDKDAHKVIDKNGKSLVSTAILSEYAKIFAAYFSRRLKNCFDVRHCGLPLELPQTNLNDSERFISSFNEIPNNGQKNCIHTSAKELIDYFTAEKKALEELKLIFTGKIIFPKNESEEKIKLLLEEREYLFLHFPDGINPSLDESFLKRVRTQIDYFIKIFNICLNVLNKRI